MTDTAGDRPEAPPAPVRPDVPGWKLLATLGTTGAAAGLLIVTVFNLTQPRIQAYKAQMLQAAVQEVLKAPASYDTLYVVDGRLTGQPPAGTSPADLEQVYVGYREGGAVSGFAIAAGEPGFQDMVRIIFGYDPGSSSLMGMKVLESKETPGLGDKIEKDRAFVGQFDGVRAPIVGVKPRDASGAPEEVDMITGATISSRTVIRIINNALDRLAPMLEAYAQGGTP